MRPNAPLWVTAALLLAGCADPDSPQTEVRRMIERLELAAEARDVGDVMTHVSSQYRDARGHDRDEIARYIRGYFIAHQAIHLLTRIERLEFPSSDEARLAVLVATANRPAQTPAPGASFLRCIDPRNSLCNMADIPSGCIQELAAPQPSPSCARFAHLREAT
ncbi:MAG TPA: hypothetical protein VK025_13900 [Steroidobacter sp.]|nr:hypothetical protein [Steroidobacter sp.]